jgi:hypothetical protein
MRAPEGMNMDEMDDDAFTDTGSSPPPPVRGTRKWLFVRSRIDRALAPSDDFGLIDEGSSTDAFFIEAGDYDHARIFGKRLGDKWLRDEFGIDLEEASSIQWFDLVIEAAQLGHFRDPIARIGEHVQVIEDGASAPAESASPIMAVACAVCRANDIFFFPDKPREAWDATCGEIVELFKEGSCLHPLCGTCSIALGHLFARGYTNITLNELVAAGERFIAAGCYDAEDLVRLVEEARR